MEKPLPPHIDCQVEEALRQCRLIVKGHRYFLVDPLVNAWHRADNGWPDHLQVFSQLVDGTMQTLKSTEGLQPLLRDIEQYVVLFLQTLKANEARTILDINPDIKKFSKARRLVDLVNENSPSPDRLS